MDWLIDVRKTFMLEITEFKLTQELISLTNAIEQRLYKIKLALH